MEELVFDTDYFGKKKEIELVTLKKPIENGLIGMIRSKLFVKDIGIHLTTNDDSEDINIGYFYVSSHGGHPMIAIHKKIYDKYGSKSPLLLTIIFHELGHYKLGHHENISKNNDQIRLDAVNNNTIDTKETGADDFAVEFLGCGIVAEGLKQLKEIIVLLGDDDICTRGAVQETDLRIDRILLR